MRGQASLARFRFRFRARSGGDAIKRTARRAGVPLV